MHSYQVDVDKRNKPLWAMMGVATVATAALSDWLNSIEVPLAVKHFVPAPSAFVGFLISYWIFDNWLWKCAPLRWLFGISEPNLAGTWRGTLKSNTYGKDLDITIHIRQRWSKLSIAVSFDKSTSSSFSAAVLCYRALPVLIYNYDNTPHDRDSDTMTRHIGTAELTLKNATTLTGTYFSSGDRKTEGSISVTRS
jgi:hypothetical protein